VLRLFIYKASKAAGSNGILTFPHHTLSSVIFSFTINRSCGERPVNSPVLIASAPVEFSTPCPNAIDFACNRWLIIGNESLRFRFLSQLAKSIS
jgi:hypothetical protein